VRANEAIERQRTEQLQTLFNLEQDLEAARAQATEYQDVENREVDCLGLLKGFRNKIFDEVLQAIGAEATAIIASMPNAQHLGVEFRSERETKKAAVQERITPIVTVYGVERNPKEALSGGQRTSLNLAVDLAIIRVVSARLGCNLNWVVFDESFNGHDPVTKASCLEMLQQYATSKLVIIVDHTSEFKELFSSVITVEYDNKESKIA
jgi:DNA repair exonuclease SbcCD ATPase subunit